MQQPDGAVELAVATGTVISKGNAINIYSASRDMIVISLLLHCTGIYLSVSEKNVKALLIYYIAV